MGNEGENMQEQVRQTAKMQRLVSGQFRRNVEKKVMDTGVYRSQHQMLMCLGENPGCSQTFLAEQMHISTAAVTTALQKLEKGGYIVREMSSTDNRANQIRITEKGRVVIEQSHRIFAKLEGGMYAGFSEAELQRLQEYYDRILKNLEKQNESKEAEK